MKAISLWQPWASLVADGVKSIETRTHDKYKWIIGQRIAIHAAKRFHREAAHIIRASGGWTPELDAHYSTLDFRSLLDILNVWPAGAVVCTAFVAEARWLTGVDSQATLCLADGLFGLVLRDVQKLQTPMFWRGAQGVFHVNDKMLEEAMKE